MGNEDGVPRPRDAALALYGGLLQCLEGRTGTAVVSAFVRFLELVFCCEIDAKSVTDVSIT